MKKPKIKRNHRNNLADKEALKDSAEMKQLYSQEKKAVSFEGYLKRRYPV